MVFIYLVLYTVEPLLNYAAEYLYVQHRVEKKLHYQLKWIFKCFEAK